MTAIGLDSLKLICESEIKVLREELQGLKHCQITFLTSAVTATGVLLGVASTIYSHLPQSNPSLPSLIFLCPLLVLLPSWWIFFDKATTITRIVGYYRILEQLILQKHQQYDSINFLGWENALGQFRELNNKGGFKAQHQGACRNRKDSLKDILKIVFLITSNRYWIISFHTFFGLSACCLIFSYLLSETKIPQLSISGITLIAAINLFILSIAFNFGVMFHLIGGKFSYDNHENYWREVLNVPPKKGAG